ncbi:MAG: AIM24 family protein [bacterium]|nr:AIM24 family protein [bacterium]
MEWSQEYYPYSTIIKINLKPQEQIFINPHSFLSSKGNIAIETQDLTKMIQNIIQSIKNKDIKNLFNLGNTSDLFLTKLTAIEESEVYLTHIIPGDIKHLEIKPNEEYVVFSDYYLGHYGNLSITPEIEYLKDTIMLKALGITQSSIKSFLSNFSLKSIFSIRSIIKNILNIRNLPFILLEYVLSEKNKIQNLKHLVCLKISGEGGVFISGFGAIKEFEIENESDINYFHIIAFQKGINYKIQNITNLAFSEHNITLRIKGPTKIIIQTRNWNALTPIINENIVNPSSTQTNQTNKSTNKSIDSIKVTK